MKITLKFIFINFFTLYSVSSFPLSWTKIKQTPGIANIVSYDSDSIKREGNFVTAWIKDEGHDLQKRKYDCGNQRYLLLYVKPFYNHPEVNFSNNTEYTGISIDDRFNIDVMKQICGLYNLKP